MEKIQLIVDNDIINYKYINILTHNIHVHSNIIIDYPIILNHKNGEFGDGFVTLCLLLSRGSHVNPLLTIALLLILTIGYWMIINNYYKLLFIGIRTILNYWVIILIIKNMTQKL